jgi:hypothetical protein
MNRKKQFIEVPLKPRNNETFIDILYKMNLDEKSKDG